MANFWTRKKQLILPYASTGFSNHLIQLGTAPGTSHTDALVKRILLDVRVSAAYVTHGTGTPPDGFTSNLDFNVCAGVLGGAADTPLDPWVDPDHRITLTGSLGLDHVQTYPVVAEYNRIASWSNHWEFDSAGIRPSPVAGQVPIGSAAMHVSDPSAIMDTALYTGVVWCIYSWLRVLYKDP